MAYSYRNLDPAALPDEIDAALRAGVEPVEVSSVEFDRLVAEADKMIYVVAGGRMMASQRWARGAFITHAVLADGGPVEAAGEFEVVELGDAKVVTALNNKSGHYRPGSQSLDIAREAFEERGLRVLPTGIKRYDWRTP